MLVELNLYTLSYLKLIWLAMSICVSLPTLIILLRPSFSTILNDLVKYGKARSLDRIRYIDVPKKWFTHFYIYGFLASFCAFVQLIFLYYFDIKPNEILVKYVSKMAAPIKDRTVDEVSCLLTMTLIFVHLSRRLLETLFVSVYSNSRMNLFHYAAGFVHYTLVPISVLAESPGFCRSGKYAFNLNALTLTHWLGTSLFVWSSYCQHSCFQILSRMRKNYLGNITNYAHGIPITCYFELVSCPHFLFEMLVYVSLGLTLGLRSALWPYVSLFVVTNQILAALVTHKWYQEKYSKTYPSRRKAILPYVL